MQLEKSTDTTQHNGLSMFKHLFMIILLLGSPLLFAQEVVAPHQALGKDFFEHPNPHAPEWEKIPEITFALFPQNITTPSLKEPSVSKLSVRAVHNKQWLAILLIWPDPTYNIHVETDQASDGCAIQFPLKEVEKTSPFMGSKGFPVAIFHWKAIWQVDIDRAYQQVTDLYPNTWVDTYRFGKEIAPESGNPIAQPQRRSPVEELIAEGFGTLTTQRKQNTWATGTWEKGQWQVVITRKLSTKDRQDPRFTLGNKGAIAFAIWDGSYDNVGARKNYRPWIPFTLEEKK